MPESAGQMPLSGQVQKKIWKSKR